MLTLDQWETLRPAVNVLEKAVRDRVKAEVTKHTTNAQVFGYAKKCAIEGYAGAYKLAVELYPETRPVSFEGVDTTSAVFEAQYRLYAMFEALTGSAPPVEIMAQEIVTLYELAAMEHKLSLYGVPAPGPSTDKCADCPDKDTCPDKETVKQIFSATLN